jgi:hypothetical protein
MNVYRLLMDKSEEKGQTGRYRHRGEDAIQVDSKATGWIYVAQGRDTWRAVVNRVITFGLHKLWGITH